MQPFKIILFFPFILIQHTKTLVLTKFMIAENKQFFFLFTHFEMN